MSCVRTIQCEGLAQEKQCDKQADSSAAGWLIGITQAGLIQRKHYLNCAFPSLHKLHMVLVHLVSLRKPRFAHFMQFQISGHACA